VGTYAALSRLAQVILLFLTSLNLLFAPFAADLHARGERRQLDSLFKAATRWALAATLPVAIVLAVAPQEALRAFGPDFTGGDSALRIMLVGQLINVATGSVGFVLIMVGRTGLDLLDNALGVLLLGGLAVPLADSHGMEGAALAAAVSFAAVNLLRLAQVRTLVGIQPFTADFLRLALPAAGCAAAAALAHSASGGSSWSASLAATAGAGILAYVLLLPAGLPAADRSALQRTTRKITKRFPR
jgi:O-antigen/teichoic acid export membrane protein